MVRNTGFPALPPVAMTMPLRARMFTVLVFGRVHSSTSIAVMPVTRPASWLSR